MAKYSSNKIPPILSPKDSAPPADRYHDYMNYRGVAEVSEVSPLFDGIVSLGRYLEPHGKNGKELFLSEEILMRHCAILGRTGSGKTESIIVPWIVSLLKNGYSVATVDVVGNLESRLRNQAKKLGCRFWYWNSDNPSSDSWNWLDEVSLTDDRDVEAAIRSILGRKNPRDSQPFFYDRDCRWLRALIYITKKAYGNNAKPSNLYRLVADQSALINEFNLSPSLNIHYPDVADLLNFSPDEHSKAVSGLLNALNFFSIPSVAKVTESSDFKMSDIDSHPTLLVIGDSLGNERAAKLSSMMVNQLINHIYRRSPSSLSKRLPMSLIIDEAPRLKDRIDYKEVLAVGRNSEVGICLAAQDTSQFGNKTETAEILSNCNTIITLKNAPPATANYFSEQLGKRREQKVSVSDKRTLADDFHDLEGGASLFNVIIKNLFKSKRKSIDTVEVPILGEREIMYPPVGNYPAVVLVSPVSNKPFLVELDLAHRSI
jgi:type IV secretory pathway TraG/TraD family ATPase VirD4